jgi:hypothetical protein
MLLSGRSSDRPLIDSVPRSNVVLCAHVAADKAERMAQGEVSSERSDEGDAAEGAYCIGDDPRPDRPYVDRTGIRTPVRSICRPALCARPAPRGSSPRAQTICTRGAGSFADSVPRSNDAAPSFPLTSANTPARTR